MISKIRVQNFRSHQDFSLEFKKGITVITGANGSGKTSLIEAIYIALNGKSWRSNFDEILRNDKGKIADWWRIDLEFYDGERRTIKFLHDKNSIKKKKIFEINNKTFARLPTKNKKPIVLFEPGDLQLLYGSPSRRRDFFDRFIAEVSPIHQTNLNKFERVLRQRNNLLKSGFANAENLFVWDLQFADLSEKISRARQEFIDKINQNINAKYCEIADQNNENNQSEIKLKFLPSGSMKTGEILAELRKIGANNFATPIGAQKDDIRFLLNRKNAKTSASRGENRTIIFAILAMQVEILKEKFGEAYVILDDIDSELDRTRKDNLYKIETFNENNLFATTLEFYGKCANQVKLN